MVLLFASHVVSFLTVQSSASGNSVGIGVEKEPLEISELIKIGLDHPVDLDAGSVVSHNQTLDHSESRRF